MSVDNLEKLEIWAEQPENEAFRTLLAMIVKADEVDCEMCWDGRANYARLLRIVNGTTRFDEIGKWLDEPEEFLKLERDFDSGEMAILVFRHLQRLLVASRLMLELLKPTNPLQDDDFMQPVLDALMSKNQEKPDG